MTSQQNPFETPTQPATKTPSSLLEDGPLDRFGPASRGQRLSASIIDALVLTPALVPFVAVVYFDLGGIMDWILASEENWVYATALEICNLTILAAAHLAIHGYLLATAGQTVGKRFIGIRIVSNEGELRPLTHLMIYRYLAVWIISSVPVFGQFFTLANCLAIFRSSKRCIHDDWAGTKVVRTIPG